MPNKRGSGDQRRRSTTHTFQQSGRVFVSRLLRRRAPGVFHTLQWVFGGRLHEIVGTRDIWCRDYMPVQVGEHALDATGAAYTTGNFHKWVCAPKGAAFLHVRRDRQARITPLTVSHGRLTPRSQLERAPLIVC